MFMNRRTPMPPSVKYPRAVERDELTDAVVAYAALVENLADYTRCAHSGVRCVLLNFGIPRPTSKELNDAWREVARIARSVNEEKVPYSEPKDYGEDD